MYRCLCHLKPYLAQVPKPATEPLGVKDQGQVRVLKAPKSYCINLSAPPV